MPVSDAQKRATAKYEKEAYDKVLVRFPKGTKKRKGGRAARVEDMTKNFEIDGRTVDFTEVTAIWHQEPEAGRRDAILIHDTSDVFKDGDCVVFEADMPEDAEDAETLLEETAETYFETLDTIEYK